MHLNTTVHNTIIHKCSNWFMSPIDINIYNTKKNISLLFGEEYLFYTLSTDSCKCFCPWILQYFCFSISCNYWLYYQVRGILNQYTPNEVETIMQKIWTRVGTPASCFTIFQLAKLTHQTSVMAPFICPNVSFMNLSSSN